MIGERIDRGEGLGCFCYESIRESNQDARETGLSYQILGGSASVKTAYEAK